MTYAQAPGAGETWFASPGRGRPPTRPNVVMILADDLGWADLGCYGATEIATPNLDRLAAGGMRGTHAYAASPWCSASRIGFYTGRYPGRLPAGLEEPLRTRTDGMGIPHDHPTIASLLRDVGYRTAMFGKWHCGFFPWYSPNRAGWERFFGCFDGALDYFEHIGTLGEPDLWEDEVRVDEAGYFTDMVSDRASSYIAERAGEQFYMQVNYTAPHWPWEGRGDAAVGARIKADFEAQTETSAYPLFDLESGSLAKYGELVETMDEGIGQILDALDAAGVADDTIVVFTSDNGGERWSKNWPFVGAKGDITEGGIRVPFIVRWPAAIGGAQVTAEPMSSIDWTATLLDAAGASPDPAYPLDGTNLLGWLLDGDAYPDHDLYWRITSQSALRRGNYKLVRSYRPEGVLGSWPVYPGTHVHLFDVTVDGREAAFLENHQPELSDELLTKLKAMDDEMLPYPPDLPGLPRHATADEPAVGQID